MLNTVPDGTHTLMKRLCAHLKENSYYATVVQITWIYMVAFMVKASKKLLYPLNSIYSDYDLDQFSLII